MKHQSGILVVICFLFALPLAAAAQDPSDAIYDESRIETFGLTLDAADWDAICNDGTGSGDQWKRATLTWQNETVPGIGVKRSGGLFGVVSDIPKPSIRISFNEFEFANPAGPASPGRKWRGVNRLKLEAMGPDPAMMRERVAYGICRGIGAPVPRACHARLEVNGAYTGLYLVEEPVRKDFVRYRWNEDGGNLYKVEGPDSSTYDWKGTDQNSYVPTYFQLETNFPGGDYSDLVQLINLINNFPADQVRTRLDGHINLDGFLRHLAMTTVYGDRDDIHHWSSNAWGGGHNHFWYHRADTNRLEIIKWDCDASQGLDGDPYAPAFGEAPLGYKYNLHPLQAWVPTDAAAWGIYKAKIVQLLDGPVAGIQSRIDSIYAQIRNHAYADTLKGIDPTWNPGGTSNAEFDAAVVSLKDWWSRRVIYLRTQVGGAPPPPPTTDVAEYVSQDVPSTMIAGQNYPVTVTMRNSGTSTWTSSGGFRLNSRGPYDNTTWGLNRVPLAAGESIAPGQEKAFTFTMTAPAAAGTYLSRWSVANDAVGGFNATTPDVNVTVTGPPPPPPPSTDNAAFVSQNIPATMTAGQSVSVTVTMRNTGTTTWTSGAGYRLNSRGPYDNTTWGLNRVALAAGDSIAPGQEKTFTFPVTAPAAAGTYLSRWSMAVGTAPFGATTPDVNVVVTAAPSPPPTGVNNAQFVSQYVPPTMTAGQSYTVDVSLRNSGTTTWTEAGQYRLTSRGPRDNTVWGINRVYLAPGDSIAPGQSHAFSFYVTAPAAAGTYLSRWSMVQDGVDVFGETTADVNVVVTAAAAAPPPAASAGKGDNANGDAWINDRCSGTANAGRGFAVWPVALLLFVALCCRRRNS